MAAPSCSDWLTGRPASRRRMRRVERQFAAVGVLIPAGRLRQIAAGAPMSEDERFDVLFAGQATEIRRDQRRRNRSRARRRAVHWLVVAAAIVIALNALLCLGAGFILLAD